MNYKIEFIVVASWDAYVKRTINLGLIIIIQTKKCK